MYYHFKKFLKLSIICLTILISSIFKNFVFVSFLDYDIHADEKTSEHYSSVFRSEDDMLCTHTCLLLNSNKDP